MKWWLPKETYTQLAIGIPPTTRKSTSFPAPTASQTAPGPKSQPNFNMVVGKPLPCQFPMHWPTNFATKHTKCLKYPKRSYFESKLATITFNTDYRARTVIKLIVTNFWCFGKNDTFFVMCLYCVNK